MFYANPKDYELDITEIYNGLYMGADPPHGKVPPDIRVVVDLRTTPGDPSKYLDLHGYLWMPTPDCIFYGFNWLDAIVDYAIFQLKREEKILIHCLLGVSRSAFVTTATLMKLFGWIWSEALDFVRSKRPVINPAPNYVKALGIYHEYLKEKNND